MQELISSSVPLSLSLMLGVLHSLCSSRQSGIGNFSSHLLLSSITVFTLTALLILLTVCLPDSLHKTFYFCFLILLPVARVPHKHTNIEINKSLTLISSEFILLFSPLPMAWSASKEEYLDTSETALRNFPTQHLFLVAVICFSFSKF